MSRTQERARHKAHMDELRARAAADDDRKDGLALFFAIDEADASDDVKRILRRIVRAVGLDGYENGLGSHDRD